MVINGILTDPTDNLHLVFPCIETRVHIDLRRLIVLSFGLREFLGARGIAGDFLGQVNIVMGSKPFQLQHPLTLKQSRSLEGFVFIHCQVMNEVSLSQEMLDVSRTETKYDISTSK